MGIGEFFSLASAVVWAFAVIMFTRISDSLPPFELNFIKNLIGLFLTIITAFILEGFIPPQLNLSEWFLLIISGVIGLAVADTLYMKALNTIGAGSTGIVAAAYSPFVILISMVYLGESLTFWQFIGLLLVISGIVFVSIDKPHKIISAKEKWTGIGCGVLSVFLTALGIVIVKPILESEPFFWSSSLRLLVCIFAMIIYTLLRGKWHQTIQQFKRPQNWKAVILASFLGAYLAMSLWLAGYKYADASIAAILNETASFFIVILAWLILKEPMTHKKIGGLSLAASGIGLVLFS